MIYAKSQNSLQGTDVLSELYHIFPFLFQTQRGLVGRERSVSDPRL